MVDKKEYVFEHRGEHCESKLIMEKSPKGIELGVEGTGINGAYFTLNFDLAEELHYDLGELIGQNKDTDKKLNALFDVSEANPGKKVVLVKQPKLFYSAERWFELKKIIKERALIKQQHGVCDSNLFLETLDLMVDLDLFPKDVEFIGSEDGNYSCTWVEFEKLTDKLYENHGIEWATVPYDLVIVFSNKTVFVREGSDCFECWRAIVPTKVCESVHPINCLITDNCGGSIDDLQNKEK